MEYPRRILRKQRKYEKTYNFKPNVSQVRSYKHRHQSTLPCYMRSIIKRRDAAWEELYRTGTTEKSILYDILCKAFLGEVKAVYGTTSMAKFERLDDCMETIEYELRSTEYWYRETKKQIFQEIREGLREAQTVINEIQEEKRAELDIIKILYD